MDVQFGPNSVDEPNLLYKLQRKLKVFNTSYGFPNRGYNLITSSSKYGLVFVASPDSILMVYYLKQLIDKECDPLHLPVKLKQQPSHIAVSCDQELLAVTGGHILYIFKISDMTNQNVTPIASINCNMNNSTFLSALQWNPCIPEAIALAYFDGTLIVCQTSTGQTQQAQTKARCICWSPKGKQLVTGNSDGSLSQYKPDLSLAKTIPAPNLFEGSPVEALAIYWISTYQFAVVYRNAADNSRPAVTIVNTPKSGQPSVLNYEDICYSMGSNQPWYYFLQGIAQWNIIMASSSNSTEIATLGSYDGTNWSQWCQNDEARPELPLTDKKQENYPVGVCIDTCAIHQLPWGENEVLPHMPLLHVVSQTGLLVIYNIINKQAVQICSPPQPLALPVSAMTSVIPDNTPTSNLTTPAPVITPAPAALIQPKVQPVAAPIGISTSSIPNNQFGLMSGSSLHIPSFQPQINQTFATGPTTTQVTEQKPPMEVKPALAAQALPTVTQTKPPPSASAPKKPQTPTVENAELKAEQEKMNAIKANQELKNMLIKEVNDFQMELYKFIVKTRETQCKLQQDLDSINANFRFNMLDPEQLKKECSLELLRACVVQLKLELVRACAVVAEARTYDEAKDMHQWTQADPLTTKRVASVKKLAYYVENQLEQAQQSLDLKWNELDPNRRPGQRMIRPILDDVYQPLVKQQEILARQQAVLSTLRKAFDECDIAPKFKSTSLLRNTPFRNKDPLTKLTKNILNMSIEPQTKSKETLLTPHKLDALRDMLSNRKTIKIKPVNVELREHLATMKLNYERSVKEKSAQPKEPPPKDIQVKSQVFIKAEPLDRVSSIPTAKSPNVVKIELKPEIAKQPPIDKNASFNSFTPVDTEWLGHKNVARTLFAEEIEKEEVETPQSTQASESQPQLPTKPTQPAFGLFSAANATASANTRSVLKDLLQNKQANMEAKNDANTFMGQAICSPSSFTTPMTLASTQPAAPSAVFTSKPITDITNMFNKFQPQPIRFDSQFQITVKHKSDETGEAEATSKEIEPLEKPKDKPLTNLFGMKPIAAPSSQSVPDVLKAHTKDTIPKVDSNLTPKLAVDKAAGKSKENIPTKTDDIPKPVFKTVSDDKKEDFKPVTQAFSKTSIFGSNNNQLTESNIVTSNASGNSSKPTEITSEKSNTFNKSETTINTTAASLFASANATTPTESKPQPLFDVKTSSSTTNYSDSSISNQADTVPSSESVNDPKPSLFVTTTASIFGLTVESQTKTTAPADSILTKSTTSTASSVFSVTPTQGSIFGTANLSQLSEVESTTLQPEVGDASTKPMFSTESTSSSSIFNSTSTQSGSRIFSSSDSVFGSKTTATQSSIFGSKTSPGFGTTSSQQSVFGATEPVTTASLFGSGTATTVPAVFSPVTTEQSVFGSTTVTTQSTVFGNPTTTTQSIFSGAPATTQTSIFGAAVAQTFGTSAPSSQASLFGTSTQSIFGSQTSTTQASIFGSSTPTTQSSVFGTAQTTQASVFSTPPATTDQGGSIFGGNEGNLFAAASISTTSAPSQTSGGNIFGGGSTGSVFGNNSSNVFGKTAFGQSDQTAASIFGGSGSFGQQTPAAQNLWAGANNNTGSGFGSSAFGQQQSSASSIFGGGTGGSFSSSTNTNQAFSSPQASAFGTSDNKSVFGSPQQTTNPAFGGSPGFGSKPSFGQSASFGSPSGFGSFGGFNKSPSSGFGAPATFGGGAAFGGAAFGNTSPGKMFGGSSPGFGAPTQSNATFETLATQSTLTFGNLAQQSTQQPQAPPSFNTSPSFTGWRG